MVRFIIYDVKKILISLKIFYIPIWLDLLSLSTINAIAGIRILHSNMVRFIIYYIETQQYRQSIFTFQYG